jgi:glycosyltransferase involved in cell wall biosynthesis
VTAPRRIVHVNTERAWRGGERQTLWLAQALARRGYDCAVAARPDQPLAARAREAGLEVFPLSPFSEWDPVAAHRLNRFLKSWKADVVHAHTGHAVGLAAFASVCTRVRRVATRRVDFPLKTGFFGRLKYGRMDAVACISSRVREMVLAGGVPAEKTEIIPSGIDPAGYPSTAERDRLRKERGVGRGDLAVVHIGALVPHKDQATLLKAVQRLAWDEPRVKLYLVGDGPLRKDLERLARELGVSDRVSFLGNQPEVLGWTALADVFVFSSKEEGLGTALLDALVMGVSTAATVAGGIPDIYGGPDAPELSPPGDPAALAANIRKVLTDPSEAGRRAARGRERAQLFTVEAMAERYVRLYGRIAS